MYYNTPLNGAYWLLKYKTFNISARLLIRIKITPNTFFLLLLTGIIIKNGKKQPPKYFFHYTHKTSAIQLYFSDTARFNSMKEYMGDSLNPHDR